MIFVDEYNTWWRTRVDRASKQKLSNVHSLEGLAPTDNLRSVLSCLNHARFCYDRLNVLSESIEWIGKFQSKLAAWIQLFEAVISIDRPATDDVVDALVSEDVELDSAVEMLGEQNRQSD